MLDYYLSLLADTERIDAFERAIRQVVGPDDVVVDLGCGVGTYAIFAARAGARRVFGVERASAIEHARRLARSNGVQLELIAGDAREVRLPEPATVLIFEDFSTGLLSDSVQSLLDAVRTSWMAEGFRVIPERAVLNAAPLSGAAARRAVDPFRETQGRAYGLDLSSLLVASHHTVRQLGGEMAAELLAPPVVLLEPCFAEPLAGRWSASGCFEIDTEGLLEGLCVWHDLILHDGCVYSNRPTAPGAQSWGQLLLPLPQPWPTRHGDRLHFDIDFEGAADGLWSWSLRLGGGPAGGQRRFEGNSFAGLPMTRERLACYRPDRVVRLAPRAEIEACVLSLVDGRRTLAEIAAELQRRSGPPGIEAPMRVVLEALEGRTLPWR